jgi:hypothetical protein
LIVLDPDDADGMAALQTLVGQYGLLPRTLVCRTGRGLHLYYSGVGIKSYNGGKLHLKAEGGYVVAPPSMHASGVRYQWINNEPVQPAPAWLPAWRAKLGAPRADQSVWELGRLPGYLNGRRAPGSTIADKSEQADRPILCDVEYNRIREALSYIPADNYDMWIRIGFSLHWLQWERSDGTNVGFELWDEWSKKCREKYSAHACETHWASFHRESGPTLTIASLFYWAKEYGWCPPEAPTSAPVLEKIKPSVGQSGRMGAMAASWQDNAFSAADLRLMTFDPVRFVLPGFVPEGVTLLVGRPKVGKSWWVLDLCLASTLDRPTLLRTLKPAQGDVLYLALEDGKRRLQRRLDKLLPTFSGEWPARLKLVAMGGWRRADQGGLADIEEWCKSAQKPILVVVDTLERFRKPATGKAPLYSADYEAISGLQKIATDFGIAIVVLHHDRKSDADDAFDTVSGTLGLTGAADTILIIKRRSNGVVLYARGRDIEESETAMQFDKETCRWTILGLASEVLRSNERARIISALQAAGQPLSTKDIMIDAQMPNRNAVDILLGKMVKDGEIHRVERGRYYLSAKITGQIGQKERFDGKAVDLIEKSSNLSNLSDLSGRSP